MREPDPRLLRARTHIAKAAEHHGAAYALLGKGDAARAQHHLAEARLCQAEAADLVAEVVGGRRKVLPYPDGGAA